MMRVDGNVRRGLIAMYLVVDSGYRVVIERVGSDKLQAQAQPIGEEKKAASQRRQPRTGRGATFSDALLDLAKKMGITMPPAEG